jgi:hypothetical protein
MLTAPIFLSEGEVQTLTGYDIEEYQALHEKLTKPETAVGLTRDELLMIHQGANTLLAFPPMEDMYTRLIGEDFNEKLNHLMASLEFRIEGKRS